MAHVRDCGCDSAEVVGMIILKVAEGSTPRECHLLFLHDVGVGIAQYVGENSDELTVVTVPMGVKDGPVHPPQS